MKGVPALVSVLVPMCAAGILLSCCAGPKTANLTAFATATSTLATVAHNASTTDIQIDAKLRAAAAANNYAAGLPLKFDPKAGSFITGKSDADWKAITAFLDAVSGYATALSQASDAMTAAREELKDDPDNSTALTGFLQAVGDIAAKAGQYKALNG